MDVVRQQVNADDLLHMPGDGFRYELVQGELRRKNPAGNVHGRIVVRITWRLAQYVEANRLGNVYAAETGFKLTANPDTVRAPDVAFVSRSRIEAVGDRVQITVRYHSPHRIRSFVWRRGRAWLRARDPGDLRVTALDAELLVKISDKG